VGTGTFGVFLIPAFCMVSASTIAYPIVTIAIGWISCECMRALVMFNQHDEAIRRVRVATWGARLAVPLWLFASSVLTMGRYAWIPAALAVSVALLVNARALWVSSKVWMDAKLAPLDAEITSPERESKALGSWRGALVWGTVAALTLTTINFAAAIAPFEAIERAWRTGSPPGGSPRLDRDSMPADFALTFSAEARGTCSTLWAEAWTNPMFMSRGLHVRRFDHGLPFRVATTWFTEGDRAVLVSQIGSRATDRSYSMNYNFGSHPTWRPLYTHAFGIALLQPSLIHPIGVFLNGLVSLVAGALAYMGVVLVERSRMRRRPARGA
jgi:hypothetical protein